MFANRFFFFLFRSSSHLPHRYSTRVRTLDGHECGSKLPELFGLTHVTSSLRQWVLLMVGVVFCNGHACGMWRGVVWRGACVVGFVCSPAAEGGGVLPLPIADDVDTQDWLMATSVRLVGLVDDPSNCAANSSE